MKIAATFLLSVTVFTALFLESSTTPVGTVGKVIDGVETVVKDVIGAVVGKALEDIETVKLALNKIESSLRRKLLVKAVQVKVTKAFDVSNAALDDAINAVAAAIAKAKANGDQAEPATIVLNGLTSYVDLSALAESTINDALAKDTKEDLQKAIDLLSQAIVQVEADLPKYVRILEKSPSKCVNSVKAIVEKDINIILAYAKTDLELLKSLLPGAK